MKLVYSQFKVDGETGAAAEDLATISNAFLLTKSLIYVLLTRNPSSDAQAQDRAYRLGQTSNVVVFRLVSVSVFVVSVALGWIC